VTEFEIYFDQHFGNRWDGLYQALKLPADRKWTNLFSESPEWINSEQGSESDADREKTAGWYKMDRASAAPVHALSLEKGQRVLDLCAGPGGKAMMILNQIGKEGTLVANEFSSARRVRMQEIFRKLVPEEFKKNLHVSGSDGIRVGMMRSGEFDRVLADVPCSSERHLIEQDELGKWTKHRSQFIAKKQYALLCSAGLALRPGGIVVYSTCSISPFENDDVIRRFLKKKSPDGEYEVLLDQESGLETERTEFGQQILPDRTQTGPMYFAVLKKK